MGVAKALTAMPTTPRPNLRFPPDGNGIRRPLCRRCGSASRVSRRQSTAVGPEGSLDGHTGGHLVSVKRRLVAAGIAEGQDYEGLGREVVEAVARSVHGRQHGVPQAHGLSPPALRPRRGGKHRAHRLSFITGSQTGEGDHSGSGHCLEAAKSRRRACFRSRRLRGAKRPPARLRYLTLPPARSLSRSCALAPPICRCNWETVVCPKPSDKGVAPLGNYVIAPMC